MFRVLLTFVSLALVGLSVSTGDAAAQISPVGFNETRFIGSVTIDGAPAGQITPERTFYVQVEALINGKVCSGPMALPPGRSANVFYISVDSEAITPGCGKPGDRITFRIEGRTANETAVWQPQSMLSLDLTVGTAVPQGRPPATQFQPPSTGDAGLRP